MIYVVLLYYFFVLWGCFTLLVNRKQAYPLRQTRPVFYLHIKVVVDFIRDYAFRWFGLKCIFKQYEIVMQVGHLGPSTNKTTALCLLLLAGNSSWTSALLLVLPAVTQWFRPFSFQIWASLVPPPRDK